MSIPAYVLERGGWAPFCIFCVLEVKDPKSSLQIVYSVSLQGLGVVFPFLRNLDIHEKVYTILELLYISLPNFIPQKDRAMRLPNEPPAAHWLSYIALCAVRLWEAGTFC